MPSRERENQEEYWWIPVASLLDRLRYTMFRQSINSSKRTSATFLSQADPSNDDPK